MSKRSFFNTALGAANAEYVGPLDELTATPEAAYSLRKLRAAYTGSAIRVRRSDNLEADIGFAPNGTLDEAALLSHCGASSGFVTTFYDQMGNSRDLSQSTTFNQPQIVSSGTVLTQNSRPIMRTLSSTDRLELSNRTGWFQNISAMTVNLVNFYPSGTSFVSNGMLFFCSSGASGTSTRFGLSPNVTSATANRLSVAMRRLDSNSYTTFASSTTSTGIRGSLYIETGIANHSTALASHYTNNAQDIAPTATGLGIGNTDNTTVVFCGLFGADANQLNPPVGTELPECIVFFSDIGSTDRNTLETNQASFYSITI